MTLSQHPTSGRQWGLLSVLLIAIVVSFSACKSNDDNTPAPKTINDLISTGNGTTNQFTIFKKALQLANLSGPLSQAGTYTVFAPTDAAFRLFGYADTNAIKAAPAALLAAVVQYHILSTRLEASAIPTAINTAQQTLSGGTLYTSKVTSATGTSTSISVNGARVLSSNSDASNGVIHVIDRVLLPPAFGNVVATIQNIPSILPTASFTFLQAAIAKIGTTAVSSLTSTGPITVFAPTDAAFTAAVPTIKTAADVSAMTAQQLTAILSYHIVPGRIYTPTVTNGTSLTTAQTGTVTLGTSTTSVTVTGKGNGSTASNITGPDITATNGVVQIIDRLLLPQ
jgi:uncharacterized surface protein with fasciclin (FAS1) repeats